MTGVRRSATLLLLAAGATAGAGPALAEERVVRIGRDGVLPQVLQAEPGDTVRFVNEDRTFAYRAQSTGGPWRFDSGPTELLRDDFVVPAPLGRPGTYAFRVAQDAAFAGSVVVGGGALPTTPPTTAPTAAPPSPAPAAAALTPAPVTAPAVRGPLPGPPSSRALGLSVTVAVVLLVGVVSLLLRLLLSLPVLSDPAATLRARGTGRPRW